MGDYQVVGTRVARVDAVDKVSGRAGYVIDVKRPGMLYGKVLRSPLAHARILSIDTTQAERLPGVKAVITGRDVPRVKMGYRGTSFGADKYILAIDRVRFIGDDVAAVAAVDKDVAEDALSLIKVEYEEMPAVFDPEEAMEEGAPLIHEVERNTMMKINRHFGDVEMGFNEADYLFEDRFTTQAQAHCCMEVHGYVAEFDPSGKLTFYASCQTPQSWRTSLSDILGIPTNKIRIVNTQIGGAFGSKSTLGSVCKSKPERDCGN